jgi:hypothetical protein
MSDARVDFTRGAAERIARAVRIVETGERDGAPLTFKRPVESGGGKPLRIGKTTATWAKNTLATITLYESGTPPNETTGSPTQTLEGCVNKWGDVQANKWVGLQRGATGPYYLVVAEC